MYIYIYKILILLIILYVIIIILIYMLLIIILYVSSAGKYCGYSSPKPIVSLGNSIFVYFDTNDRYTERGFKALYRAVAPETTSGKDNGHYIMT